MKKFTACLILLITSTIINADPRTDFFTINNDTPFYSIETGSHWTADDAFAQYFGMDGAFFVDGTSSKDSPASVMCRTTYFIERYENFSNYITKDIENFKKHNPDSSCRKVLSIYIRDFEYETYEFTPKGKKYTQWVCYFNGIKGYGMITLEAKENKNFYKRQFMNIIKSLQISGLE